MKAEIFYFYNRYRWRIKAKNGVMLAVSRGYTRKDNARRGLRNFVEKMWTTVGIEKIMDNV